MIKAMIIPAVFDENTFGGGPAPVLGAVSDWALFWNDVFAQWWSTLRPSWRLEADVFDVRQRPVLDDAEPPTFSATARTDEFSIVCRLSAAPGPTVVMSGATRILRPTRPTGPARTSRARVVRIQFVTMGQTMRTTHGPFPYRGGTAVWQSPTYDPATAEFTELTRAPDSLTSPLAPGRDPRTARRHLLLLDLDTAC